MDPQILNPSDQIDHTFWVIFGFQLVILLLIVLTTFYFLFRYHHKRNPSPEPIEGNLALEIIWTVLPLFLVVGMFYSGWVGFMAARTVPSDAFPIKVTAKKWAWKFEYPNGKISRSLLVPKGKPIRVSLTSLDVLHSFYIPAFRVKMDVLPGRETYTWFYPNNIGTFTIYCAEYCGLRHAKMLASVGVAAPTDFDAWYSSPGGLATTTLLPGEELLEKKGCVGCHSIDGSELVGPTFLEIFGRESTIVDYPENITITVDEEYLSNSILEPTSQIVDGYENLMPKLNISPNELKDIVSFLKTLK